MIKRIISIILGVALTFCLFASYGDEQHQPGQLLIWYVFTPRVLQVTVWIILFFVASWLIWGSPKKAQSRWFYNLLVKIFGDPKKNQRP